MLSSSNQKTVQCWFFNTGQYLELWPIIGATLGRYLVFAGFYAVLTIYSLITARIHNIVQAEKQPPRSIRLQLAGATEAHQKDQGQNTRQTAVI